MKEQFYKFSFWLPYLFFLITASFLVTSGMSNVMAETIDILRERSTGGNPLGQSTDGVPLGQSTGGSPSQITIDNPLGTESIIKVINNVLNFLIYISVPLLALMVLIGGFQILLSRGGEKVKEGMNTIKYAAIGFTAILVSKGIALVILRILKG